VERRLRQARGRSTFTRGTLEINPSHAIVRAMNERFAVNPTDPLLLSAADLLLGMAAMAEGSAVPDPPVFSARMAEVLERVLTVAAASPDPAFSGTPLDIGPDLANPPLN
jgi:HSP90 family molecular chaperone